MLTFLTGYSMSVIGQIVDLSLYYVLKGVKSGQIIFYFVDLCLNYVHIRVKLGI